MSDSIGYAGGYAGGAATAGDYGTYALLVSQTSQINARINTLTEQASTGLVSTVFSGLGAGAQNALDLSSQVNQQTAQIAGIASAGEKLTLTQSVLSQIGTIAANFAQQTTSLNTLDPENMDNIAASANASLQQLAGLLNTQNGQDYLFGGSETGAPPIPNAGNILTSGFYTSISTAVQGLATNGASATIASTLATASSNTTGISPFSAALSQPAGVLQATLPTVEIGGGASVTIGVVASANTRAVSTGASTTGSYTRDLMRALATLGSLSSSQVSDAGFASLVSDTTDTLNSVVAAVADDQGVLGNTQTQITAAGTALTADNTALTSQISSIQNVNIARVSTQLTETQANLQASYKLIVDLSADSLVAYLPT
jgi:flagellar hook-associated protein 3 FlgL